MRVLSTYSIVSFKKAFILCIPIKHTSTPALESIFKLLSLDIVAAKNPEAALPLLHRAIWKQENIAPVVLSVNHY